MFAKLRQRRRCHSAMYANRLLPVGYQSIKIVWAVGRPLYSTRVLEAVGIRQ